MAEFKFGDRVLVKKECNEEDYGIVIRTDDSSTPVFVLFPSLMAIWFEEEKVRLDPDHYPEAKPESPSIPDKWKMLVTEYDKIKDRLFMIFGGYGKYKSKDDRHPYYVSYNGQHLSSGDDHGGYITTEFDEITEQQFLAATEHLVKPTLSDNWKMRVTPEESRQVQERLFELGYKWYCNQVEVQHTSAESLYFDGHISYGKGIDYFNSVSEPEITPQAFLDATEHLIEQKTATQILKELDYTRSAVDTPQTGITKVTLNSMGHLVPAKLQLGEPVDFNIVKSQGSEYDALKQTVSEMRDYTPAPQPVYKCPLYMYPHGCGEVGTKGEIIKHVKKDHEGERAPSEKSAVWNILEVK